MTVIILQREVWINCSRALEVKLQPDIVDFEAQQDIKLISSNSKGLQKEICNWIISPIFDMNY